MADGPNAEIIGKIGVSIGADYSEFAADAAKGNAIAAQAGQQMAASFNTAAAGADTLTAAAEGTAVAEKELAASAQAVGAAHGAAVTQIQAASGALRVLEGSGGIRAAERFITLIPGIGAALQLAFPLVGAIALYEAFERATGRAEELKTALKELQSQAEATDRADITLIDNLDRIGVEKIGREGGPAAQAEAESSRLAAEARDAGNQILGLESKIKQLRDSVKNNDRWVLGGPSQKEIEAGVLADEEKINQLLDVQQGKLAQAGNAAAKAGQLRLEQSGGLGAKNIEATEAANQRAAQMSKQRADGDLDLEHDVQTQRIQGIENAYERTVATGQEEIRFEKAKQDEITGYALATRDRAIKEIADKARAESAGKSQPQQALIAAGASADTSKARDEYTETAGKSALAVQAAQSKATLSQIELNRKVAETLRGDIVQGWDAVAAAGKRADQIISEQLSKQIVTQQRVGEIEEAASGNNKALLLGRQKVELETQYGSQVAHTRQQEIDYANQLAAIDDSVRTARLTGLAAELQTAEATSGELRDETKIAELKAKLQAESGEAQNAGASTAGKNNAAKLNPEREVIGAISGGLGAALAKGIADGGKGLGRDVEQSLKNAGQQILGTALTAGIQHLISTILIQTGAQAALNVWLGANSASQVANTAAVAVNSAAVVASTVGMVAVVAALAANTAALIVNSVSNVFGAFADGGDPPVGVPSMVGERGPEMFIPKTAGTIIPNGAPLPQRFGGPSGGAGSNSPAYADHSQTVGELHFHAHGMQNPRAFVQDVARQLPNYLRSTSPNYSPASK